MLLGAKIVKKSTNDRSWRALGGSGAILGAKMARLGSKWFPCVCGLQHKSLLERSWGGLGALLGSSWAVLGGLWEVSWAIVLALGRSWRSFGSASVTKALPRAFFFPWLFFGDTKWFAYGCSARCRHPS